MQKILENVTGGIKWFDDAFAAPVCCLTGLYFAVAVLMENCFGVALPLFPKFIDPKHITTSEI